MKQSAHNIDRIYC